MTDQHQLRHYVIQPVLKSIGLYSEAAMNLLVMTAAQESNLGQYVHQLGNGPARGIFQMEEATYKDIWHNYLHFHHHLADVINGWRLRNSPMTNSEGSADELSGNWYYATAMARVQYLRVPDPLPDANDTRGLAKYYKRYYNTPQGAATVAEALDAYNRVMGNAV